jgi:hypothetical protein
MSGLVALTSIAAALLLIPATSPAATVVNGDFEAGTLSGWQTYNSTEFGEWFAYTGSHPPLQKKEGFFPPPQGNWAAVDNERRENTAILYRDIALEPYWAHQLTMTLYYHSYAPIFVPTPNTLALFGPQVVPIEGEPIPTQQQVRVDVVKPTAPIESLDPGDILTTLFANKTGDPETMPPTQMSADLTPFAGQTVRLRIANAVNDGFFNTGVDAVSVTSTPPSNAFTIGKLKLKKKNGTGTLSVTVPGAGALTLADAGGSKKATTSKKKRKRAKLVKPAAASATAGGTVTLAVKPTGAGKKIERRRGKLKIAASLSFTPTGGIAATQSFKGTLKLKRK